MTSDIATLFTGNILIGFLKKKFSMLQLVKVEPIERKRERERGKYLMVKAFSEKPFCFY